ncbi:hypothetical protein [Clostridium baratii]|nr:hypothetical protein [Clostridium baratii]KJU72893.1 hypothetical protein UC77_02610 [Clostridium baratii]
MRIKKRKQMIICMFIVLIITIFFVILFQYFSREKDVLFYINNEPVFKEEIINSSEGISLSTRNELMRKYNIKSEEFSWDKLIEGDKRAIDFLKEKVMYKSTYEKILQINAKENDLIEKIDYKSIKKDFDKENKRRSGDKSNNKVVYGNINFTFDEYYQYINSNLAIQLRKKLIDDGLLKIRDEELKLVYENNKDMFKSENKETGKLEILPFEKVKSSVIDVGLNEKFNQYMEQKVKDASIKIKDEKKVINLLEEELI